jgi:hypothetical protein
MFGYDGVVTMLGFQAILPSSHLDVSSRRVVDPGYGVATLGEIVD